MPPSSTFSARANGASPRARKNRQQRGLGGGGSSSPASLASSRRPLDRRFDGRVVEDEWEEEDDDYSGESIPAERRESVPRSSRTKHRSSTAQQPSTTAVWTPISMLWSITSRILSILFSPIRAHLMFYVNVLLVVLFLIMIIPFCLKSFTGFCRTLAIQFFRAWWNGLAGKPLFGTEGVPGAIAELGKSLIPSTGWTICSVVNVPLVCGFIGDRGGGGGRNKDRLVNDAEVAQTAMALQREALEAKDIFDQLANLGVGGVDGGLYHTKIWELATAVKVSSNLPAKQVFGEQLHELGDLTRDLSDEVSRLSAQSGSAFTWITHDFERTLATLTSSTSAPPTAARLEAATHSLMTRLQEQLDALYVATERAIPFADRASSLGGTLIEEMTSERQRLKELSKETPVWMRYLDRGKALAVGQSEPSKLEMLHTDLQLTSQSIGRLRQIRDGLELTRAQIVKHRNDVGLMKSGFMGFHLAGALREGSSSASAMMSEEEARATAEAEIKALAEVVKSMKDALKVAKEGRRTIGRS